MKSKLKKCKYCGELIAKNANVCPHCGANLIMSKPGVIIGIILWAVAVFLFFKGCSVIG